ncbi:uncharacterized protein IL334_001414 [Kwoniella shivajii]|uniref:Uncharacterized protein n=1 Tax=Kwoniella shivajii TaxID=564305 RepID=A0ABZ1CW26_9TREE|nr:hypothetical protein IL334_001414 [Kwoniella shivajii]
MTSVPSDNVIDLESADRSQQFVRFNGEQFPKGIPDPSKDEWTPALIMEWNEKHIRMMNSADTLSRIHSGITSRLRSQILDCESLGQDSCGHQTPDHDERMKAAQIDRVDYLTILGSDKTYHEIFHNLASRGVQKCDKHLSEAERKITEYSLVSGLKQGDWRRCAGSTNGQWLPAGMHKDLFEKVGKSSLGCGTLLPKNPEILDWKVSVSCDEPDGTTKKDHLVCSIRCATSKIQSTARFKQAHAKASNAGIKPAASTSMPPPPSSLSTKRSQTMTDSSPSESYNAPSGTGGPKEWLNTTMGQAYSESYWRFRPTELPNGAEHPYFARYRDRENDITEQVSKDFLAGAFADRFERGVRERGAYFASEDSASLWKQGHPNIEYTNEVCCLKDCDEPVKRIKGHEAAYPFNVSMKEGTSTASCANFEHHAEACWRDMQDQSVSDRFKVHLRDLSKGRNDAASRSRHFGSRGLGSSASDEYDDLPPVGSYGSQNKRGRYGNDLRDHGFSGAPLHYPRPGSSSGYVGSNQDPEAAFPDTADQSSQRSVDWGSLGRGAGHRRPYPE